MAFLGEQGHAEQRRAGVVGLAALRVGKHKSPGKNWPVHVSRSSIGPLRQQPCRTADSASPHHPQEQLRQSQSTNTSPPDRCRHCQHRKVRQSAILLRHPKLHEWEQFAATRSLATRSDSILRQQRTVAASASRAARPSVPLPGYPSKHATIGALFSLFSAMASLTGYVRTRRQTHWLGAFLARSIGRRARRAPICATVGRHGPDDVYRNCAGQRLAAANAKNPQMGHSSTSSTWSARSYNLSQASGGGRIATRQHDWSHARDR